MWSNRIGYALLPVVNTLGNLVLPSSHFKYHNENFSSGTGLYPGEQWCGPGPYPHAKWHQQSAVGLADLTFLADYIHECIKRGPI